jgi:hypothetical protein
MRRFPGAVAVPSPRGWRAPECDSSGRIVHSGAGSRGESRRRYDFLRSLREVYRAIGTRTRSHQPQSRTKTWSDAGDAIGI